MIKGKFENKCRDSQWWEGQRFVDYLQGKPMSLAEVIEYNNRRPGLWFIHTNQPELVEQAWQQGDGFEAPSHVLIGGRLVMAGEDDAGSSFVVLEGYLSGIPYRLEEDYFLSVENFACLSGVATIETNNRLED